MAHSSNPSTSGGPGRRTPGGQGFDTSLGNKARPCFYRKKGKKEKKERNKKEGRKGRRKKEKREGSDGGRQGARQDEYGAQ